MDINVLKWIESWYKNNCNGDWEHSYGITIETLDNPGWDIKIDLKGTPLENEKMEYKLVEQDENDWYGIKIENAQFIASGDPNKLEFLITLFKEIVQQKAKRD